MTQLPARIKGGEIAASPGAAQVVPALIADAGEQAGWRYVEFFTANCQWRSYSPQIGRLKIPHFVAACL